VSGRRTEPPPLVTPDAALLADIEEYIEPIVAMEGFDAVFFDGAGVRSLFHPLIR